MSSKAHSRQSLHTTSAELQNALSSFNILTVLYPAQPAALQISGRFAGKFVFRLFPFVDQPVGCPSLILPTPAPYRRDFQNSI